MKFKNNLLNKDYYILIIMLTQNNNIHLTSNSNDKERDCISGEHNWLTNR